MQLPPGYESQLLNNNNKNKNNNNTSSASGGVTVCKLKKALYGIKQAPHEWHHEINSFLLSVQFTRCVSDSCVYVKKSKAGHVIIIFLFVDDIVIAMHPSDKPEVHTVRDMMNKRYKVVDLGQCKWILQMGINYGDRNTITLTQNGYTNKLLQRFGMSESHSVSTPITTEKLSKSTSDTRDELLATQYMQIVGSLLYASISTRPDISYAVGALTRYNNNPNDSHMVAAKHVLRYLRGTCEQALVYTHDGTDTITVCAYVDSDYANDVDDRKSITGYVVKVNGCTVSWNSKKQTRVATSTAEAEYIALNAAGKEVQWVRALLGELGFIQKQASVIYCDNQAAVAISKHDSMHDKSKHFDIAWHWIREAINNGQLDVQHIASKEQQADILTKPIAKAQFQLLRQSVMGM
jgi:hypothetical protein